MLPLLRPVVQVAPVPRPGHLLEWRTQIRFQVAAAHLEVTQDARVELLEWIDHDVAEDGRIAVLLLFPDLDVVHQHLAAGTAQFKADILISAHILGLESHIVLFPLLGYGQVQGLIARAADSAHPHAKRGRSSLGLHPQADMPGAVLLVHRTPGAGIVVVHFFLRAAAERGLAEAARRHIAECTLFSGEFQLCSEPWPMLP